MIVMGGPWYGQDMRVLDWTRERGNDKLGQVRSGKVVSSLC